MQGYEITDLSKNTQRIIKERKIDTNGDGLINEENGELANLLSATGKKDINDLTYDSWFDEKILDFGIGSIFTLAGVETVGAAYLFRPKAALTDVKNRVMQLFSKSNSMELKTQLPIKGGMQAVSNHTKMLELLQKGPISAFYGTMGLFAFGMATYLFTRKPTKTVFPVEGSYNTVSESKKSSEQEKLDKPANVKLIEYIPQKGEYWTSILKAKYGVDTETAQKMASKIKEMIYDDATASKQAPIMYLPETWAFEGKTYTFNESAQPKKAEGYSDKVKTEMGKMSKDLKYE